MKKLLTMSLAVTIVTLLISYSCAAGGAGGGSCKDADKCVDYIGKDYTPDSVKGSCLGEYSDGACSSTGSKGTCLVNSGQANEQKITYLTGTANDATANCTAAGGTSAN